MDQALLEAQRSGSGVAQLNERLRAGRISATHVDLAAKLGHPGARALEPRWEPVDWSDWEACEGLLEDVLELDRAAVVRAVADWSDRARPACEDGELTAVATEAARAWADAPDDEQRTAAEYAGGCDDAPPRAMYAAGPALVAIDLVTGRATPRHVFLAAQQAVTAIGWPPKPLERYFGEPDLERSWQQLRLAEHLLGER
jgi:hypothetical protein